VPRPLLSYLAQLARGFAMGSADVVPGVSGGTVALVLGIYERLVANVRGGAGALGALVRGQVATAIDRLRHLEWLWLITLLAGIGTAILVLAHTIETLLEEQPVRLAALFFGLIAGSAVLAWRLLHHRDLPRMVVAAVTALVAFVVLGYSSGPVEDPAWWMFLAAGAVAICAMILPGVSGSFLLLMFGMYDSVLGLVTQRDLVLLAVFAAGCVVGLAVFSTALHWALAAHHDTVLAAMVGLMLGSLRVLWPWPDGTDSTSVAAPADDVMVPVLIAVAAAAVVLAITFLAGRRSDPADAVIEPHASGT
jgi:putative membrane protein